MQVFSATLNQMFVLFTFIALGYFLNAKGILPLNTSIALSRLETNVLVPCLVFNTFYKYCTIENISEAEFVNLRIMLENNGCRELKRDFFFSAVKKESPLIVKSHHGVLMLGKKNSNGLYPAAIYLKQKKTLLLGIGVPEK